MRWIVLLLLLPLALAGTADDPEVQDATGDQAGATLGNDHTDIVKAWIEPVGFDGYHTFLEVGELDTTAVRYEMTWRVTNLYDLAGRETYRGVRAQYVEGQMEFYHLAGDDRQNMVANASIEDVDMAGNLLAWDRPLGPTIQQGDTFDQWQVIVENIDGTTENVIGTYDTATGARALTFHTFPPFVLQNVTAAPTGTPLAANDEQRFWMKRLDDMWVMTVEIPTLDVAGPICDWSWDASVDALRTHVSLRIGDNWLAPQGLSVRAEGDYPANVAVQPGSPGIVQLQLPSDAFEGKVGDATVLSKVTCADPSSELTYLPPGDDANIIGWFAVGFGGLLVLVALAVVIRKKLES